MAFTWIDYVLLAIILISTIISLWRGFISEIISLTIWIVAFVLAFHYAASLGDAFKTHIISDSLRLAMGFVIILIAVLLIGAVLKFIMNRIRDKKEIGVTDRISGTILGLLRGLFLVIMIILLGELTTFSKTIAWQNSVMIPHLQFLTDWTKHAIPNDFMNYISFKQLPDSTE